MGVKFVNNFATTISGAVNSSATTIPIASAAGFPTLVGSDYAYCTLYAESPFRLEIVKVTAASGTNLTVIRAQESTTAAAFPVGSAFELRITAAGLNEVSDAAISVDNATALAIALG